MQRVVARGGNRFLTGAVYGVLAVLLLAGLARVPTTITQTGENPDRPDDPATADNDREPLTDEREPRLPRWRFPNDNPRLGGPSREPADRWGRPLLEERIPCGSPSYFDNASHLESYLGSPQSNGNGFWWQSTVLLSGGSSSSMVSYSGTNNQVEGVDEADTVKTDGTFLYIANWRDVRIYKAHPPDQAGLVSTLSFPGYVRGLFVNDGRLVVLWTSLHDLGNRTLAYATHAHVINVDRPDSPVLERNVTVVARYIAARMIRDQVYLVAGSYVYGPDARLLLPIVYDDGVRTDLRASEVGYFPDSRGSRQFAIVFGFDLQRRDRPRYAVFLAADTTEVYVSGKNVYLAGLWGWYGPATSWIHRIAISESLVCYVAGAEFPGYLLNQFSMDEFQGHLRVATTARPNWGGASVNNVYVLNRTMVRVGTLEGLAPGETIYSARFLGERAYLVTFKKIDPLFVVDLSDPTAPRVLGYLKIPGYSDYLHPYDRDHVIGLGKDTFDMGDFAWYQGVRSPCSTYPTSSIPRRNRSS